VSSVAATYLRKVQVDDNAMVSTKMLYDASFRVRYDDIITLVAAIFGRLGFVFGPWSRTSSVECYAQRDRFLGIVFGSSALTQGWLDVGFLAVRAAGGCESGRPLVLQP